LKNKLMVSTSGIRGVIGAGLDPVMVSGYAAAFGTYLKGGRVVIGRDSRPSGEMIKNAAISALQSVGVDVIDIGMVPTPTLEIAVSGLKAKGGICITASHNPSEWNALKMFDRNGEFINKAALEKIKEIYAGKSFALKPYNKLGKLFYDFSWVNRHIKSILKLKGINRSTIKNAGLTAVVDAVNGAGSEALPSMLETLGVDVIRLYCEGDGNFAHEPEPIPKNLKKLGSTVKRKKADIGFACDPDADRLALVDEKGNPIGEELTLALAVDFILSQHKGPVVINLSTSRVTEDMAKKHGVLVRYTPVGEANVIAGMKKAKAVIGGEGNGGVIYPASHYGRDSLVGAAIICSILAKKKKSLSSIVETLPKYHNIKLKAALPEGFEKKLQKMEKAVKKEFGGLKVDRRDGLRFDFEDGWFQIRKSNTEPIYRLIIETNSKRLTESVKKKVTSLLK